MVFFIARGEISPEYQTMPMGRKNHTGTSTQPGTVVVCVILSLLPKAQFRHIPLSVIEDPGGVMNRCTELCIVH